MPLFALWKGFPSRFVSRQPVGDRLLIGLLTVGSVLLVGFAAHLPLAWQVFLWGLVLIGLAVLLRRGLGQFFGPVFFYDLVRTARKGQQIGHRCLYAVVLIGMIFVIYWSWFPNFRFDLAALTAEVHLSPARRAEFAQAFFTAFFLIQLLVVLVVTPAYTAGAIVEEKDRRTLEYLLATDLSDREIVLGMMAARLANLFLLVMAGLPVLSFFEFLGGVDPNLVLAGYVVTGMTVLSLGSLSILMSVLSQTPLAALIRSYLWGFGYLCAISCCSPSAFGVFAVYSAVSAGGTGVGTGGMSQGLMIASALLVYSGFHALITVVCCRQAIAQLRPQTLGTTGRPRIAPPTGYVPRKRRPPPPEPAWVEPIKITAEELNRPVKVLAAEVGSGWGPYPSFPAFDPLTEPGEDALAPRPRPLPPLTGDPLLWKELYTDQYFGLPHREKVPPILVVFLLIFFVIGLMALLVNLETDQSLSGPFNSLVRTWGTLVCCCLPLVVGLSAARRVTRERQRQTLDSLLTVPRRREDILFAKWLASLLSVRGLWWVLFGIWGIGVVTGGLHLFALPLLAAAALVYLVFMASLGLWFSTVSASSVRATLFTLLAGLVMMIFPGALASVTGVGSGATVPGTVGPVVPDWGDLFLGYGLNPPQTLWALAFRGGDFAKGKELLSAAKVFAAVAGLHVYLLAGVMFWLLACARLKGEMGRGERGMAFAKRSRRDL